MPEKSVVTSILRYLKTVPGCFCWKEHGGMYGTAGIPDIIACVNGRFVALEVKTPSGKATKLQEATIKKILKAGGVAAVVRSVDEVRAILKENNLLQGSKQ
jgi:Holliday junction resolvase